MSLIYRFAQFAISSDRVVPELSGNVPAQSPHLADVRWAVEPADMNSEQYSDPMSDGSTWSTNQAGLVKFRFPDLASFSWHGDRSRLTIRACRAAAPNTIRHLLLDHVLPRVLAHTGRTVLHASCVLTDRGIVAFIGRSGLGKSTLSAALTSVGCKLLSDDGLALTVRDHVVEACATYPSLRLLPDSLTQIFGDDPETSTMAVYSNKRRVHAAFEPEAAGLHPLWAIYALEGCGSLRIAQRGGRAACAEILANAFQLDVSDRSNAARLLHSTSQIIRTVPVFALRYPRRFSELPRVCAALQHHWTSLPGLASEQAA